MFLELDKNYQLTYLFRDFNVFADIMALLHKKINTQGF